MELTESMIRNTHRGYILTCAVCILALATYLICQWLFDSATVALQPTISTPSQPSEISRKNDDLTSQSVSSTTGSFISKRVRTHVTETKSFLVRILDSESGWPMAGLPVSLRPCSQEYEMPQSFAQWIDQLDADIYEFHTGDDGWIDVSFLKPAFYSVTIDDDYIYVVDGGVIEVDKRKQTNHYIYTHGGSRIIGSVVDNLGNGVAGAIVYTNVGLLKNLSGKQISDRPSPFSQDGERTVRTDIAGKYIISSVPPNARLQLIAMHSDYAGNRTEVLCMGAFKTQVAPEIILTRGGTVHVKVQDHNTKVPISGARVQLQPPSNAVALRSELRSDDSGLTVFKALPYGRYRIFILADGYAVSNKFVKVPALSDEPVVVSLKASGQLGGIVIDSSTKLPVSEAKIDIRVSLLSGKVYLSKIVGHKFITKSQGRFMIRGVPAGPAELVVRRDGYISRKGVEVQSPVSDLVIQLDRGNMIRGKVVDASGLAVNRFRIDWMRPDSSEGRGYNVFDDDSGQFAIRNLGTGSWIIKADVENYYAVSNPVYLYNGTADKVAHLPELHLVLKPKKMIGGLVLDSVLGVPVAGAEVRVIRLGNERSILTRTIVKSLFKDSYALGRIVTDDSGKFRTQIGSDDQVLVIVRGKGFKVHRSVMDLRESSTYFETIRLRALKKLRGIVRTRSGVPVTQAYAYAMKGSGPIPVASVPVSSDGTFELNVLDDTLVIWVVSKTRLGARDMWSISRKVKESNPNVIEFIVPQERGELYGIVTLDDQPLSDVSLSITMLVKGLGWSPMEPVAVVATDKNGVFSRHRLAPGDYRIRLRMDTFRRRLLIHINKDAAAHVRFDLRSSDIINKR